MSSTVERAAAEAQPPHASQAEEVPPLLPEASDERPLNLSGDLRTLVQAAPMFGRAIAGYSRVQVDTYVQWAEDELAGVQRENDDLLARYAQARAELEDARSQLSHSPGGAEFLRVSRRIGAMLAAAADQADGVRAEAQADRTAAAVEARQLLVDAAAEAGRTVAEAVAQAEQIIAEADATRAAAQRVLEEAEQAAEELRAETEARLSDARAAEERAAEDANRIRHRASSESAAVLMQARDDAVRLLVAAREQRMRADSEAAARRERLDRDAAARRAALLGELEDWQRRAHGDQRAEVPVPREAAISTSSAGRASPNAAWWRTGRRAGELLHLGRRVGH